MDFKYLITTMCGHNSNLGTANKKYINNLTQIMLFIIFYAYMIPCTTIISVPLTLYSS